MEIKNNVAIVSQSQERMWEVIIGMGEDVKSMMEGTGTGNLSPIPKIEENPDALVDDDIPLIGETAGPSSAPFTSFFMKRLDAWEEISNVKNSVTFGVSMRKPTKGSTGVLED